MNKPLFLVLSLAAFGCDKKKPSETTPAIPAPAIIDAGLVKLDKVEVPEVRIKADGETTVHVKWSMPKDTAVNDDAPFRIRWKQSDGLAEAPSDVKSTGSKVKDGFEVKVAPMKNASNPTLGGEIDIVVCDSATHSVCVPVHRSVELGFVAAKDATTDIKIDMPLPSAH